jgi:hypothetical protein
MILEEIKGDAKLWNFEGNMFVQVCFGEMDMKMEIRVRERKIFMNNNFISILKKQTY